MPESVSTLRERIRELLDDATVQPSETWYRVYDPSSALWCESNDPGEVVRSAPADRTGYRFQRLRVYRVLTPWESWDPRDLP